MDDYADFLAAQALMESGKLSDAETLLRGFAAKYPRRPSTPFPWATGKFSFPSNTGAPIEQQASKNGLDPYMVASLIRQSEFNPAAISSANACGLMQLLPSVGRSMAREEGIRHFNEVELLNPETNHPPRLALPQADIGQVRRPGSVRLCCLQCRRQPGNEIGSRSANITAWMNSWNRFLLLRLTITCRRFSAMSRSIRALHAATPPAQSSTVAQQKPSGAIAQQKQSDIQQKMMPAQQ